MVICVENWSKIPPQWMSMPCLFSASIPEGAMITCVSEDLEIFLGALENLKSGFYNISRRRACIFVFVQVLKQTFHHNFVIE